MSSEGIQSYINMYPFSPKPHLLSRLPHNIEPSSLYYRLGPFWLSILNIAVCRCQLYQLEKSEVSKRKHQIIITIKITALKCNNGSVVKNLPAMQETKESQVQSLGQEDPLEEAMATHSSILVWKIPWTEEFGGL